MIRGWKLTSLFVVIPAVLAACSSARDDSQYTSPAPRTLPLPGAQPTFAKVVTSDSPPPPISGGTLAVAPDGRTVIAADPDRDQIYVVDIPSRAVKHTVRLAPGSEPGRVTVDTHGKAHVALRSSGNVATVDLVTGTLGEQHVCVAPRGIAFDKEADSVHVACAEGQLVTLHLTFSTSSSRSRRR